MLVLFGVLVILSSIILGLIVLVQNPKGGGLSGTLGGFSNQLMGVKQTTDVLEKGTWIFAAIVGLLCLFSVAFIPSTSSSKQNLLDKINAKPTTTNTLPAPSQQPATPLPAPPANKK